MSKAFDTVDINTLINKFDYYCQNNVAKNWIANFFQNRQQFTKWNNYESTIEQCFNKSIVQGSTIGPKMFNVIINDITKVSCFQSVLFADDTNLILSNENPSDLENIANRELEKIKDFFDANGLIINTSKTSFVHIKPNKIDKRNFNIKIGQENITQNNQIEFLGVIIDEDLNFNYHYNKVFKKVEKGLNALISVKNFLTYKAKLNIYHSLIHSHFSYCALSWMPNIKQQQLKKLILKQKKALRILFNVKYNSHTSLLFHLSQITKVEKIVEKESILLVHKYFKGDLPDAVTDLINSTKITGCNTRSQTDKIIYTSIKKDEKLTIGKIIEFWNRTNMTNRNNNSTDSLKKAITKTQNKPIICTDVPCISCNFKIGQLYREMRE